MALIKLSSNYRQFFPRNYIARGWNGAIIGGISVVPAPSTNPPAPRRKRRGEHYTTVLRYQSASVKRP